MAFLRLLCRAADKAPVLRRGACAGTADPVQRVGHQAIAAIRIVPVERPEESQQSFLHHVLKRLSAGRIAARLATDEAQVRLDELLDRLPVSGSRLPYEGEFLVT